MIRKLLVGTVVAVLGLLGSVAEADFINKVTVTLVTKKAELKDLVKEAERAKENAEYAVSDAKEARDRVYRFPKSDKVAIKEAEAAVCQACDAKYIADERLKDLRQLRCRELSKFCEKDRDKRLKEEAESRVVVDVSPQMDRAAIVDEVWKITGKKANVSRQDAEIRIVFGTRICASKTVKIPVADVQLRISFEFPLHARHLRESTSDRAKVLVNKDYRFNTRSTTRIPIKGWKNTVWDLVSVSVEGEAREWNSTTVTTTQTNDGVTTKEEFVSLKKVAGKDNNISVRLLPQTKVENVDARLMFAGETERERITSRKKFAAAYAQMDSTTDVEAAIITYEFPFENAVD